MSPKKAIPLYWLHFKDIFRRKNHPRLANVRLSVWNQNLRITLPICYLIWSCPTSKTFRLVFGTPGRLFIYCWLTHQSAEPWWRFQYQSHIWQFPSQMAFSCQNIEWYNQVLEDRWFRGRDQVVLQQWSRGSGQTGLPQTTRGRQLRGWSQWRWSASSPVCWSCRRPLVRRRRWHPSVLRLLWRPPHCRIGSIL